MRIFRNKNFVQVLNQDQMRLQKASVQAKLYEEGKHNWKNKERKPRN